MEMCQLLDHESGVKRRTATKCIAMAHGVKVFQHQDHSASRVIYRAIIQLRNGERVKLGDLQVERYLFGATAIDPHRDDDVQGP
jgi:hypothetical protein